MNLVNERERRNLAAVGTTHAASLLAQFAQAPAEHSEASGVDAQCGHQLIRGSGDGSVTFSLEELAKLQAPLQLKTKQISKPADKGPGSTVRPLAVVKDFLSYVLKKKDDTGTV